MKVWIGGWAAVLLACVLPVGVSRSQDVPQKLSPEEERLRQEAVKLQGEGATFLSQGRLADATERQQKAVELFTQVYSREKYPNGHADMANSLSYLGGLLEARGQHAQAEPFLRQALEVFQKLYPDGHPQLATSLNDLGVSLWKQGKYGEAEALHRRALEVRRQLYPPEKYPDGHPLLAVSLTNLGMCLQSRGEDAEAEPLLRQALEILRKLYPDGHPNLASCLNNLGSFYQARGEYAEAEPLYRQALEMYQKLYPGGHVLVAHALNNLASLLWAEGEYARAEPLLRQALEVFQKLYPAGHPLLATGLNNLGVLLQAQGEYARAEVLMRQALQMRQNLYPRGAYSRGHPDLAHSLNGLGDLLLTRGEYEQAEPLLRQALEMFEKLYPEETYPRGHPALAESLRDLGNLLGLRGDYAGAVPLYRRALEMRRKLYPAETHPRGHPDLAHSLNGLGYWLQALGEYDEAESLYRQALEMFEAFYPPDRYPGGHPELAAALNNVGALLQVRGEYARAEPFLWQSLEMRLGRAEHLAAAAPEPMALNYASTFPLTRDAFLSVTRHEAGSDSRAYEAVWRTKAALTRVYRRRHLALVAATDEGVRRDWDQLQSLRRQREQLLMGPAPPPARRAARDERLSQLNDAIDRAEEGLVPRLPALRGGEELGRLGPGALQRLLPDGAVLVDFLRYTFFEQDPARPGKEGEERTVRYVAFVVSRRGIKRVELAAAADVDAAVAAWREAITEPPPAGNDARREHQARIDRRGETLRGLVWGPVQEHIPADTHTVYLAPDAALTQLPWAALPVGAGGRVLLEDYALAVLPHGPFLLEQLTPPPPRPDGRPPAPEGLLLVGGVRYDDRAAPEQGKERTATAAAGAELKVNWSYLPGTEQERRLIERLAREGGRPVAADLAGPEATTGRLRDALEHARYAHVATHGFFADRQFRSVLQLDEKLFERRTFASGAPGERIGEGARSPLVLSGLVCAGANRPETPERGILSADAVAGLLLDDLQLAVLSACDTGAGDVAGGEGVYGLQRAFHIAGCKNVVASLWKVDDAATAALMTRFYGHLWDADRPLPPIEALRRAQLDLYRHPGLIAAWSKGELRAPGLPGSALAQTDLLAEGPPPARAGGVPAVVYALLGLVAVGLAAGFGVTRRRAWLLALGGVTVLLLVAIIIDRCGALGPGSPAPSARELTPVRQWAAFTLSGPGD